MSDKIAYAHLLEFPDHYDRSDKLEKDADADWKKKM